jgi:hypothetical protein
MQTKLDFLYPCKTYLERVYKFQIIKKNIYMLIFRFPRPSLAVILFFPFLYLLHTE